MTLKEYFMGRDANYPPADEVRENAEITVEKANRLLEIAEMERGVRSGYRPTEVNLNVPNASHNSKHITCEAVDIADNDGKLKSWCLQNLEVLEDLGLWMESPEFTPTWVHIQIVPPHSGHRVFIPYKLQ